MPRGGFQHPLLDPTEGYQPPTSPPWPGDTGQGGGAGGPGGPRVPDDVARNEAERRESEQGPDEYDQARIDAAGADADGLTAGQQWAAYTNIGQGAGRGIAGLINMFRGSPDALIDAYTKLKAQFNELDDPEILTQIWNHPVLQQIARYRPELVQGFHETMADFEGYEGDPEMRAKESEALATVSERARRGDPEMQRLRSREAAATVGRGLARAGGTAQEQAARRGMPGQAVPGMAQAGAQFAGQVGTANVMASRKSQESAEALALQGSMGIRQGRESQGQQAANLRNQFRNAMSNRQLSVSMSNQKSRQAAEDKNQGLAQSLHERNALGADQRRRENQQQQNRWETDRYARDRQRLLDTGSFDIGIAQARDQNSRDRSEGLMDTLGGLGSLAGGAYSLSQGGFPGVPKVAT